ncbi:sensor histidine kinase VxrA [Vibrio sp. HB161653]|uniref:histidine kinase n=1 Tax=Vibrio sp. HB236076 TaxID=3232307 RepID=A0AB39HLL2_9VIBR|nr:sensor histidine kinase VxrA [Vibrio sp. HB161653]MDP5252971.1 sensor histidine kinase VxrA [Vibrio sp. HB161653]
MFSLVVSILWIPTAWANSLPERIGIFVSLFNQEQPREEYDVRVLQSKYPTVLISPDSTLPQTAKYPLRDIQRLYQLSQTCSGQLPLNPLVTEPLVFTRALCKGTHLSIRWFSRSNLIHPGGGTYAYRYAQTHPDMASQLEQYMHVKERSNPDNDPLLNRLKNMPNDAIYALINRSSMFIDGQDLWLKRGDNYLIYGAKTWQGNVSKAGLQMHLLTANTSCFVKRGNICWDIEDQSQILKISMIALIVANVLLVLGWLYYRWNTKKRELRSRMLVLQILTHELRTPIASLSLTVEGFRRDFEHLPESLYDEFRRLCEDSRRLRQLAEASKDYLQSDNQQFSTEWLPSVREWLEFKVEDSFPGQVEFKINHDVAARINVYWLGNCIENLLRNAVKYGVAPVCLQVDTCSDKLTISVIDQGQLSAKDWSNLRKPFVSKSGLGLGLTIVESMVGRMGGKMKLYGPPTTFILEIPCETDVAFS